MQKEQLRKYIKDIVKRELEKAFKILNDDTDKTDEPTLDEISNCAGVDGYMTPNAFTKDKKQNKKRLQSFNGILGMSLVHPDDDDDDGPDVDMDSF